MRLVEVEIEVGVAVFQRHEPRQVTLVAIHAEDTFSNDKQAVVLPGILGHQPLQLFVVVVTVAYAAGLGETDAVDDTRMDQLVGQDERPAVGHGRQDAAVGVVAAVEDEGALGPVKLGQPLLEPGVYGIVAREQARRGGGEAAFQRVECLQKFALQRHVVGQSQIVVRREVQHFLPVAHQIEPLRLHLGQFAQVPFPGQRIELRSVAIHHDSRFLTTSTRAEVRKVSCSLVMINGGMM